MRSVAVIRPGDPSLLLETAIQGFRGEPLFCEELLANPAFPLWLLEDPTAASWLWHACQAVRKEHDLLTRHQMVPTDDETILAGIDPVQSSHRLANSLATHVESRWESRHRELDFAFYYAGEKLTVRDLPLIDGDMDMDGWTYEGDGSNESRHLAIYEYSFVCIWKRAVEEM